MSQIRVKDQFGNGLGGIPIRVAEGNNSSESAPFDYKTNDDGSQTWPIPFWPQKPYTLYVNQGDYANGKYASESRLVTPPFGDNDFTLARVGESGFLHVDGLDFKTENGRPWCFAGYASYTVISEIAKGHDINPLLDEAISYGANTLVPLGMDLGSFAHDHGFAIDPRDPQWSTWLATLFETTAAKGMRCALGVFQQAQALSDSDKQTAWQTACDVARGRWNVLLRLGNEDDVNGWRHEAFSQPTNMQGVLVSTGSRGGNNPPTPPNWDFAEWEPRRGPLAKALDDCGAGAWEMYAGYPGFPAVPKPIVVIEPAFFYETEHDQYGDFRWYEPWKALRMGLNIGANFAGGTFGSSEGLEARPNGPIAAECARQFYRGLFAAFLR